MAQSQIHFGSIPAITASPGGTANIFHNDEAMRFLNLHGYTRGQYNDKLLAYFRNLYGTTKSSLPDLLARYIRQYGKTLPPTI